VTVRSDSDHSYSMFTWGGKFRAVPENFRFELSDIPLVSIWELWWLSTELEDGKALRPYKKLLENYKRDIVEAYKSRSENHSAISRSISEVMKVMKWFESIDGNLQELQSLDALSDKVELKRKVPMHFVSMWNHVENSLQRVTRSRHGQASLTRRRHDLTRLNVRPMYERILALEKHNQSNTET
jgi:hypothetical protein